MKVYVDGELPDNCKECKCKGITTCGLLNKSVFEYMVYETSPKDCPLRYLSDYTKQVRKEVINELKNKMLYCSERFMDNSHYYNGKELDEILDQIQGETEWK